MTTELKPCPFCGATEDEIMIMADWEEATDNSGNSRRIQCAACNIEAPFYPNKNEAIEAWNARAVPDVPELVRYGISMFGNGAVEMGEGEYVRYDQVAGMLAAKYATLNGLLNALKHHTGDSHGLMAIRKLVERAEAAEAKLAEYEKQKPVGVIHQGVFYSTKDLEEYPEYSTGIKIYASPAPMESEK